MISIKVNSLIQFMNYITEFNTKIKINIFEDKNQAFFRGHTNCKYQLMPNIAREITQNQNFLRFERKMIDRLKLYHPDEFNNILYPINLLAKMQHYGLPTRLLDLTRNSLVALYFACCDRDEAFDGQVFCFLVEETNMHTAYSIYANVAAFSYRMSGTTVYRLHDFTQSCLEQDFMSKHTYSDLELQVADTSIYTILSKPLFVEPEYHTERQKRQQAAFIIFPNEFADGGSEPFFKDSIAPIEDSTNELYSIINVDGNAKNGIMDNLELLGITESFLFPEISNTCKMIRNETIDVVKSIKV